MFKELEPLLASRSLVLTLAAVEGGRIRVTVNPVTKKDVSNEVKDAVVPFSAEGSAEELDAELAGKIGSYTEEHISLDNSLAEVRAEMEAARKEAKEEADKKRAEMRKKPAPGAKSTASTTPAAKPADEKKEPPPPPSLFGMAEKPAAPAAPADGTPATQPATVTEGVNNSISKEESNGDHTETAVA